MSKLFFLFPAIFFLQLNVTQAQYHIDIHVRQMAGQKVTLGYYTSDSKLLVQDSVILNSQGKGTLRNEQQKLARGLYLLVFSRTKYFDLLIGDQQNFSVWVDTLDIQGSMRIEGSPENQEFLKFQRFIQSKNREKQQLKDAYDKHPQKNEESARKKYLEQLKAIDRTVQDYLVPLRRGDGGSALMALVNFSVQTETPDFSKEIAENTPDREVEILRKTLYYEKDHYWERINLQDSIYIRIPGFKNKLENYFSKMLPQHPDTICQEAIRLIEKARRNTTMLQYMTATCFNYALKSEIMGMDEAWVKLGKRYYLSRQVKFGGTEENLRQLEREIALTQYNLIGQTAVELKLPTLEGNWVSLHETEAPFILLLFWEENCGHCKKQVPQIKQKLLDRFKPYGFKIFAVHGANEKEKWERFIIDHELFDFINCWDPHRQSNFQMYYHVDATPVMYMLDKNKKIIGKKLSIEQYADMLVHEYKKIGIDIPTKE